MVVELENGSRTLTLIISATHQVPRHWAESTGPHSLQSKTPLRTIGAISPPFGHCDRLASAEKDEDEQHVKVEPCIKRRGKNVIISRPQFEPVPVDPVHDDEPCNEAGGIPGAQITVKGAQTAEKDGDIPQVEPCSRE